MKREPSASMLEPVVAVRRLGKRFTMHLRDGLQLPVLDGVSLQVAAGECVALVGPSGRGKSTLMKCLYGSYGSDSGEILLRTADRQIDVASATPQDVLVLRQRTISYVSQFLRVVPRVSTLDIVAQRWLEAHLDAVVDDGAYDALMDEGRVAAAALLARLNLPRPLWDLPPATFSGGEQQRVNVARGFIVAADLLLLDEPTASLDLVNRDIVVALIREAKADGTAVVGIFHDPVVREAVADRSISFD